MTTVMQMHWREATPEQYDQARERVGCDRETPSGAKLHLAGFSDDGLHVTDVWESEQAFNTFMEQRLAPAIQEIGIPGQPQVKCFPPHGVYAPALGGQEQVSDLWRPRTGSVFGPVIAPTGLPSAWIPVRLRVPVWSGT